MCVVKKEIKEDKDTNKRCFYNSSMSFLIPFNPEGSDVHFMYYNKQQK